MNRNTKPYEFICNRLKFYNKVDRWTQLATEIVCSIHVGDTKFAYIDYKLCYSFTFAVRVYGGCLADHSRLLLQLGGTVGYVGGARHVLLKGRGGGIGGGRGGFQPLGQCWEWNQNLNGFQWVHWQEYRLLLVTRQLQTKNSSQNLRPDLHKQWI